MVPDPVLFLARAHLLLGLNRCIEPYDADDLGRSEGPPRLKWIWWIWWPLAKNLTKKTLRDPIGTFRVFFSCSVLLQSLLWLAQWSSMAHLSSLLLWGPTMGSMKLVLNGKRPQGCNWWWFINPSVCGRCFMIVTWLILPVVICLSQRLSHACLSISDCTAKLRMAH